MRILFISDNFPPEFNAPASRTYEHARYWVKWGHEVTVITCAPNFPDGKLIDGYKNKWHQTEYMDGIKVVRVKTFITTNEGIFHRILDYLSFMLCSFFSGLTKKKPDLIIATSPQLFSAISGWLLSLFRGVPFIFELRDLWPASILAVGAMQKNIFIPVLERIELFLYHQAEIIVALTESFKKDLIRRGIPEKKIHIIPNGADTRIFIPRAKDEELLNQLKLNGKFIIGYIGTHGMAQGLDSVLNAAVQLKSNPSIHFLFMGSGAEKQFLLKMSKNLNLPNVTFIHSQPRSETPNFWSICDVALVHLKDHPVFKTVIPSKIFEAMAMGIPLLLAIPDGEASSIIQNNGSGYWVNPEDPAKLCEAIDYLYNNPEQLLKFKEAGLTASTSFSREKRAKEMISVFNFVISGY